MLAMAGPDSELRLRQNIIAPGQMTLDGFEVREGRRRGEAFDYVPTYIRNFWIELDHDADVDLTIPQTRELFNANNDHVPREIEIVALQQLQGPPHDLFE